MNGNPITQVQIEQEILRIIELLEQHTEEFETLCHNGAKKEAQYKRDWAGDYISNKTGSIKERESWADYRCSTQRFEYQISEALVKAKREKLLSLRSSLDALRTLNANVRQQAT